MKTRRAFIEAVVLVLVVDVLARAQVKEMSKRESKELESSLKEQLHPLSQNPLSVRVGGLRAAGITFDGNYGGWRVGFFSGTSYLYLDKSYTESKDEKEGRERRTFLFGVEKLDDRMQLVGSPPHGVVTVEIGDLFTAGVNTKHDRKRHKIEIVLSLKSAKNYEFVNALGGKMFDIRLMTILFWFSESTPAGDIINAITHYFGMREATDRSFIKEVLLRHSNNWPPLFSFCALGTPK